MRNFNFRARKSKKGVNVFLLGPRGVEQGVADPGVLQVEQNQAVVLTEQHSQPLCLYVLLHRYKQYQSTRKQWIVKTRSNLQHVNRLYFTVLRSENIFLIRIRLFCRMRRLRIRILYQGRLITGPWEIVLKIFALKFEISVPDPKLII